MSWLVARGGELRDQAFQPVGGDPVEQRLRGEPVSGQLVEGECRHHGNPVRVGHRQPGQQPAPHRVRLIQQHLATELQDIEGEEARRNTGRGRQTLELATALLQKLKSTCPCSL